MENFLDNRKEINAVIEIQTLKFSEFLSKESLKPENYWLNNTGSGIDNYILDVKKAMFNAAKKKTNGQDSVETLMFTPDSHFVVKQTIDSQEFYYINNQYNLLPTSETTAGRRSIIGGIILKQVTVTILKQIGLGLASSLASVAGKSFLNKVFGQQGLTISDIRSELANNVIDVQAGRIDAVLSFVTIEYPRHLEAKTDNKTLLAMLENCKIELLQALSILEQNHFSEAGLKTYITGASLMIAILIEMSNLSKSIHCTDPHLYSDIKAAYIPKFVLHVSKTAKEKYWAFEIVRDWLLSIYPQKYIVKLIFKNSKEYVFDIDEESKKVGANLIHFPRHDSDNQQFLLIPVFEISDEYKDCYYIISYRSGMAIDVPEASKSDNVQLIQWYLHGAKNQIFRVEKQKDGSCKIYSKCNNKITHLYT